MLVMRERLKRRKSVTLGQLIVPRPLAKIIRDTLRIRVPDGQVLWVSRRRLFLSTLFLCNSVKDLRSTNENFLWSNGTFCNSRFRLGWVNESGSHDDTFA